MSVSGRTVWWAKDAGWYRRAAVIKLKRAHGPLGLVVVDWLTCEAKSQDDGGWVKSGAEAVAEGVGSEDVLVRPVLSDASGFGVIDDFEDHGDTFVCRISGWAEEQEKVADAQRKRAERAAARREKAAFAGETSGATRPEVSESVQTVRERPQMSPTGQDSTRELHVEPEDEKPVDPEAQRLCDLLASLIIERDKKAKVAPASKAWTTPMDRLLRLDERTPQDVERIIRWCQADSFWQANILSPAKLREKFTALNAKAPASERAGSRSPTDIVAWRNAQAIAGLA